MQAERYTLGLDVGIASVGAALLGEDRLIDLFVRTFDKAEVADTGESLNSVRRTKRLTRRRLGRRALRLKDARKLFWDVGLIPNTGPPTNLTTSPWELRAQGLDRKLSNGEWAAVLYHILKHRGFQSTRKAEEAKDKEAGQMLAGVGRIESRLAETGYRTLGELFARDDEFSLHKRNKRGSYENSFSRDLLVEEFTYLFEKQRSLGNTFANDAFKNSVMHLLMRRRPALSGDSLLKMVGKCTFEPAEFRAPRASYSAEKFIWLSKLNNIIVTKRGTKVRLIDLVDDGTYLNLRTLPFTKKSAVTFKDLRKVAGLSESFEFPAGQLVSDKGEESKLFEAKGYHEIRKIYKNWARDWKDVAANSSVLDGIAYALTVYKNDSECLAFLKENGVSPDIAEALISKLSFSTFVHLSTVAITKILPFLESKQRYNEAVVSAGYEHHSYFIQEKKGIKIPPLKFEDYRNPVVYRALNQTRKLYNAIVDKYGPPDEVHIELARDLSRSHAERDKIKRRQDEYRKVKDQDVIHFNETFGQLPRKDQLQKWALYREQGGQCPYCQLGLDCAQVISDGQYSQIDHIIPFSRCFDDSKNNKVLCHIKCNQDKSSMIPFEYFGSTSESEKWKQFVGWVETSALNQGKKGRLLKDNIADTLEGFIDRNLNDTRYIARALKALIENNVELHPDSDRKRVLVISGSATAILRRQWGILKIRENGDLHHARDAAVIAACSAKIIKKIANYSKSRETKFAQKLEFPVPWPHFREELEARLSSNPQLSLKSHPGLADKYGVAMNLVRPVRVSRAPKRLNYGAAHQETIRSAKLLEQGLSWVRTDLKDLKASDIEKIVGFNDPRNKPLIDAIRRRLDEFGGEANKAFQEPLYKPAKDGSTGPIVRSVKVLSTQVSGFRVRNGIADNADMMRVDIFTDGKNFFAVPVYVSDAVREMLPMKAAVPHKSENEWVEMSEKYEFRFSLHPNDWICIVKKNGELIEGYFGSMNRNTASISIWLHDRDRRKGKDGQIISIGVKTLKSFERFEVDMLGNLYKSHATQRMPVYRS